MYSEQIGENRLVVSTAKSCNCHKQLATTRSKYKRAITRTSFACQSHVATTTKVFVVFTLFVQNSICGYIPLAPPNIFEMLAFEF